MKQTFEDVYVEKEVVVRKRISKVYVICSRSPVSTFTRLILSLSSFNKRENDFATLDEYNDYLERVEELGKYMFCALGVSIFLMY